MKKHKKAYYITVSTLFFVVAVLHLIRGIAHWPLVVGTVEVPAWLSIVVAVLLMYLAGRGFSHARR